MDHEIQSVETGTQGSINQSFSGLREEELATALTSEGTETSQGKALLACLSGMLVPGLGHLLLGRWGRAFLLALSILGMFAAGLFWMEGHLYRFDPNEPLSIFPVFANAGLGGIYGFCYLLKFGYEANAAATTYEYGNTFLFVSGLLNYLVVLDAYDIATGRKQ